MFFDGFVVLFDGFSGVSCGFGVVFGSGVFGRFFLELLMVLDQLCFI